MSVLDNYESSSMTEISLRQSHGLTLVSVCVVRFHTETVFNSCRDTTQHVQLYSESLNITFFYGVSRLELEDKIMKRVSPLDLHNPSNRIEHETEIRRTRLKKPVIVLEN